MATTDSLRVFISYARRDCSEFAEELLCGLDVAGFDPFLDRHDIAAGEDWEVRLGGLIQSADTVVFVMSPAAVKSERCAWEVSKAEELSKRIIPVVALDVLETDTPPALKRLNYIFFSQGHSFARALGELSKALRTDLEWVREHTRLSELAARWRDRQKADVLLLRGSELETAKSWLAAWKAPAPEPTDLHRAFIGESDVAENSRAAAERKQLDEMAAAQAERAEALKRLSRRTTLGLVGASGLTVAAGGLATWAVIERRGREEAQARSVEAAIERESSRTDIVGQFTAYAAEPGQPASDSSLYSDSVLAELRDRDVSFLTALSHAHANVYRESGDGPASSRNKQRPYFSSDLNGEIYLRRHSGARRSKGLVISMDTMGSVRLPGVAPEARQWLTFLQSVGIETEHVSNPDAAEFNAAVGRIRFEPVQRSAIEPREQIIPAAPGGPIRLVEAPADTLAFVFFAGGGGSWSGNPHFALRGFRPSGMSPGGDRSSVFRLRDLQQTLRRQAATSILVLDTNFIDLTDAADDQFGLPPDPVVTR